MGEFDLDGLESVGLGHGRQRISPVEYTGGVDPAGSGERPLGAYQGSRCSFSSQRNALATMVSRLSSCGDQPSCDRVRWARAMMLGGSPSRRGSSLIASSLPATRCTLSNTSRTL